VGFVLYNNTKYCIVFVAHY